MKPLRICIGVTEISGIAAGLAAGFAEIGIDARVLLSHAHPFGYKQRASDAGWVKRWQKLGAARKATSRRAIVRKVLVVVAHQMCSWLVFFQVLLRYDAFVYLFGDTFTRSRTELRLLRLLGKKVIMVYVGSDVRPPYMSARQLLAGSEKAQADALLKASRAVKEKMSWQECLADCVVNAPATAQFGETRYIDWFSMGIPKAPVSPTGSSEERNDGRVRILHSPSNPVIKGTALIVEAIDRLAQAGHPIDFVKIEGLSNERVLQELAACDFVVDQMYSDTPMAVFATEAAMLGKPAVVAGYFSEVMGEHLAPEDVPPSLYVRPEDAEAAIERLILDVAFRKQLGEDAKRFVSSRWSPAAVAGRYLRLIRDDVPDTWWREPSACRYIHGCGVNRETVAAQVGMLIRHYGPAALQVADKPNLQALLCGMAQQDRTRHAA